MIDYAMEAEVQRVLRINDTLRDQLGRMENRAVKAESDLDIEQQVVQRYSAQLRSLGLRRVQVAMLQAADVIDETLPKGNSDLPETLRDLAKELRMYA